jgi:hypothetical protein
MRSLKVVLAAALVGTAIGLAAPASACEPYDGSCGYINPDPHGGSGWVWGGWYPAGWYGGNYWCGGYWRGQWC